MREEINKAKNWEANRLSVPQEAPIRDHRVAMQAEQALGGADMPSPSGFLANTLVDMYEAIGAAEQLASMISSKLERAGCARHPRDVPAQSTLRDSYPDVLVNDGVTNGLVAIVERQRSHCQDLAEINQILERLL
jgi:hypothetical protein